MAMANSSDLYQITSDFVVDQIISHSESQNAGDR
ncbi:hypothetical protein GGD50_002267 [Rhizobium paranaense]|uniref:Uncharacterized protein n=1 Tax=Rhizobium paranaense TaxID=1650438 RepID=A0A7W8XQW0_9HYPH|nr:hypothetical protein [Rhizobium paranaense]